jgi:hypothetical protein
MSQIIAVHPLNSTNLIQNPGFEASATFSYPPWWSWSETPGTTTVGIDSASHSGSRAGWLQSTQSGWQIMAQTITVEPYRYYKVEYWYTSNVSLGMEAAAEGIQLRKTTGAATATYLTRDFYFNPGPSTSVNIAASYLGVGGSTSKFHLDDVSVK